LDLNRNFKNAYTRQIKVLTPEIEVESENAKFLNRILEYIEENIHDSKFSVEDLSRHVGMSRSALYNKLVSLTGQSPLEFIRNIKLDKAAVLIEKSDFNIAQIGYMVGFSSPNYLAKTFKAKFGILPSEYLQMKRQSYHVKRDLG
jgi:AraC-like DNA-binding protein